MAKNGPVDEVWGEREDLSRSLPFACGDWTMLLTGHGIDDLSFRGDVLARRISVRDRRWATPAVAMTYRRCETADGRIGALDFGGNVDDLPRESRVDRSRSPVCGRAVPSRR